MPDVRRIAVLVSGQGRNLQALVAACAEGRIAGRIALVLGNRANAAALDRARAAGIATRVLEHAAFPDRESFDSALIAALDAAQIDLVLLAGFMRILGAGFVRHFAGRLLNIHPSLLPRHPGLHTHRRALEAGDAEHGATVHFVTEELDGGPAIIQGRVRVRAEDTADTLAERVMQDIEVRIYPQAVALIAGGDLALRDGQVLLRGKPLTAPLQLDDTEGPFR